MRAYWWRGHPNFGDALTPLLLREFAGVKAEWSPIAKASIVVCGSVLQGLSPGWDGTVLGSGRLRAGVMDLSAARLLALRGPFSAPGFAAPAYGDPALLVPFLVERPEPRWDVGVVPHWSDGQDYRDNRPGHLIDVGGDPLTVVREIASCRKIISSSLHGVIVAHAYGIPAKPRLCARVQEEGGEYKFKDYAAAYGMAAGFWRYWFPPAAAVSELQLGLLAAFKEAGR